MDFVKNRPGLSIILVLIVGFALGLLYGWFVDPVEWTDASPATLHPDDQARYLRLVADNFFFEGNVQKARDAFRSWPNAELAVCQLAAQTVDAESQARLEAIVPLANPEVTSCAAVTGEAAPAEEAGSNLGATLLLLLVLIILVVGILFAWNRRSASMAEGMATRPTYDEMPEVAPVVSGPDEDAMAVPIARFRTSYARGHDAYDDSFSIENAGGDFLGECGVGISESVGTDTPKNVTAFEVWLFDKNDIRTITKVVMSDHAFFDDALKAKLATKGEQVLAREQETIVLETASLIINAEITEMTYGDDGALPPQSYFESVTFELSAWAKEGEMATAPGDVDDMLAY